MSSISKFRHWRTVAGLSLLTIGLSIFVFLFVLDQHFQSPDSFLMWLAYASIGLAGNILAVYPMIVGAKLLKRSADLQVSIDRRSPILYLRSFNSEKNERFLDKAFNLKELYLAKILRPFGPVVTVGVPTETLPNLGAARFYFQDENWHQRILEIIKASKIVVLRSGISNGLLWELAQVIEHCDPEKVLIFFPEGDRSGHYRIFKESADRVLPQLLPEKLERPKNVSFISFDKDWRSADLQSWYSRNDQIRRFPVITRSLRHYARSEHYHFDMLITIKPFLAARYRLPPKTLALIWLSYAVVIAKILSILAAVSITIIVLFFA